MFKRVEPVDTTSVFAKSPEYQIEESLPYDPKTMRWLFIWTTRHTTTVTANGQQFQERTWRFEAYYAADADGPWASAGTIADSDTPSIGNLEMIANGDGSTAGSVTVHSPNK